VDSQGWHTISTLSIRDSPNVRSKSALFRRMTLIKQISDVPAISRIFPEHNEVPAPNADPDNPCVLTHANKEDKPR